ncbi:hypothetical protein SDC9_113076 [bioreactor metagenome]|uniref:Uncharacterized protein n=1 Tax=bioreactor metagenome TaxID=1076179 RepID=A0A645BL33_9ZZZZ
MKTNFKNWFSSLFTVSVGLGLLSVPEFGSGALSFLQPVNARDDVPTIVAISSMLSHFFDFIFLPPYNFKIYITLKLIRAIFKNFKLHMDSYFLWSLNFVTIINSILIKIKILLFLFFIKIFYLKVFSFNFTFTTCKTFFT